MSSLRRAGSGAQMGSFSLGLLLLWLVVVTVGRSALVGRPRAPAAL